MSYGSLHLSRICKFHLSHQTFGIKSFTIFSSFHVLLLGPFTFDIFNSDFCFLFIVSYHNVLGSVFLCIKMNEYSAFIGRVFHKCQCQLDPICNVGSSLSLIIFCKHVLPFIVRGLFNIQLYLQIWIISSFLTAFNLCILKLLISYMGI